MGLFIFSKYCGSGTRRLHRQVIFHLALPIRRQAGSYGKSFQFPHTSEAVHSLPENIQNGKCPTRGHSVLILRERELNPLLKVMSLATYHPSLPRYGKHDIALEENYQLTKRARYRARVFY